MSYEGHVQQLCSNGHYLTADAYSDNLACACGAGIAWSNSVDDTNGDSFGVIPPEEFEKILVQEAVVETCNLGHNHVTSLAVYRIPQEGELQRFYLDYRTEKLAPIDG